jgi:hypothetical protein
MSTFNEEVCEFNLSEVKEGFESGFPKGNCNEVMPNVLDCGNLNDNAPPSAFFKEWIANGGDCKVGFEYAKRCSTGCQQANSSRRCA